MAEFRRWCCETISCLHPGRWWVSAEGVIQCLGCRPPSSPDLIIEQGDEHDAPEVDPRASNIVAGRGYSIGDATAPNRPVWILRGNRVPEKVEARQRRRKSEIPSDVTHWCYEGDAEWRPWGLAALLELFADEVQAV